MEAVAHEYRSQPRSRGDVVVERLPRRTAAEQRQPGTSLGQLQRDPSGHRASHAVPHDGHAAERYAVALAMLIDGVEKLLPRLVDAFWPLGLGI